MLLDMKGYEITGKYGPSEIIEYPAEGGALYTEGENEQFIPNGTLVSMNFWGFQYSMMKGLLPRVLFGIRLIQIIIKYGGLMR